MSWYSTQKKCLNTKSDRVFTVTAWSNPTRDLCDDFSYFLLVSYSQEQQGGDTQQAFIASPGRYQLSLDFSGFAIVNVPSQLTMAMAGRGDLRLISHISVSTCRCMERFHLTNYVWIFCT